MAKIKKGDLVVVIAGKDRGQQGRVLEVLTGSERVIVEGVQRVTKHVKPGTRRDNQSGGIIHVEAPIHVSNVMLVDPEHQEGHPCWVPHRAGRAGRPYAHSARARRQALG